MGVCWPSARTCSLVSVILSDVSLDYVNDEESAHKHFGKVCAAGGVDVIHISSIAAVFA